MKAKDHENSRLWLKPMPLGRISALGMVLALGALQVGCASNPEQDAAEAVEQAQAEAVQQEQAPVAKKAPAAEQPAPASAAAEAAAKATVAAKAASSKAPAEKPAVVAKPESKSQPKPEVKNASEKKADDMMASLAAKDKFAVIAAEPAPEPKTTAPVASTSKPAAILAPVKTAPAEAAKPAKKLVKKALNAGAKDLPITIEMWSLGMNTEGSGLHLSTPTWQMGDGSYLSQIWLTVEENRLLIHSSSDIDPSASGSGVVLNGGALTPYSRIESGNIAVLDGNWMDKLSDGGVLEIYMGFFPGKKPKSPTYKSEASLDALTRLVPTYQKMTN